MTLKGCLREQPEFRSPVEECRLKKAICQYCTTYSLISKMKFKMKLFLSMYEKEDYKSMFLAEVPYKTLAL